MLRKSIGGCGCMMFILAAVIASFWAGARYGNQVKRKFDDCKTKVVETTRAGISGIDRGIRQAQDAADALSGNQEEKPERPRKP